MRRTIFKRTVQLLHALPEPVPLAGAIVVMVVFGSLASCAHRAQAGEPPPIERVVLMRPGSILQCINASGCVAMKAETYLEVREQLSNQPAQTCRRSDA